MSALFCFSIQSLYSILLSNENREWTSMIDDITTTVHIHFVLVEHFYNIYIF